MNIVRPIISLPIAVISILVISFPVFARGGGGGAANLMNSPGYQRAQKEARENYLRRYNGGQQVVVRKKHRRHPR